MRHKNGHVLRHAMPATSIGSLFLVCCARLQTGTTMHAHTRRTKTCFVFLFSSFALQNWRQNYHEKTFDCHWKLNSKWQPKKREDSGKESKEKQQNYKINSPMWEWEIVVCLFVVVALFGRWNENELQEKWQRFYQLFYWSNVFSANVWANVCVCAGASFTSALSSNSKCSQHLISKFHYLLRCLRIQSVDCVNLKCSLCALCGKTGEKKNKSKVQLFIQWGIVQQWQTQQENDAKGIECDDVEFSV